MADGLSGRSFVSMKDLSGEEIVRVLDTADALKRDRKAGKLEPLLAGRTLAMIFQKPSLRTRVSFETGMTLLGGHAIYLAPTDIKLGQRESTEDIAIVVSRFADIIMARTFAHVIVLILGGASVGVFHPVRVKLVEHHGYVANGVIHQGRHLRNGRFAAGVQYQAEIGIRLITVSSTDLVIAHFIVFQLHLGPRHCAEQEKCDDQHAQSLQHAAQAPVMEPPWLGGMRPRRLHESHSYLLARWCGRAGNGRAQ